MSKVIIGIISLMVGYGLSHYTRTEVAYTPINENEILKMEEQNPYQYIPSGFSLEQALESENYTHCISYPGVGLIFGASESSSESGLIISEVPKTYPAASAGFLPGMKVLTPLSVIKGEIGTPVKIQYKVGKQVKTAILKRTMIKKCLRKKPVKEIDVDSDQFNKIKDY